MRKMRFGIRAKIMIGYAFIIFCLTLSFVLVIQQLAAMQRDRNYVIEHDFAVNRESNLLEKYVMDMENGQRGYLLTGEAKYLEPYTTGQTKWRDSFNQLRELTSDTPVQEKNLIALKESIENWLIQTGGTLPTMRNGLENESYFNFTFFITHQNILDIRSQLSRFRSLEMGFVKERAAHLDAQNEMLINSLFVMLGVVLIFSLLAALLISRSIVGTIKQVTKSIIKLSTMKRDRSKRIHVTMNDEVKDLADATNALLESQEEIEWQQRKLTEVVHMLQGISDLETLGTSFIRKAAELFGASFGVFYIRSVHEAKAGMMKLATYAAMEERAEAGKPFFYLGEGLIGQCAIEKRIVHLTHVPETYILLKSGLGSASAQSVLIVPIIHNQEVIAIMELASFDKFTSLQLSLMDDILEVLGTIVHSVQTRVEVERLLREYQVMTEELQSQQEELHLTNEQLEERNRYADERSRELEHMKVSFEEHAIQLELSSRYKSEFLANMSHELRTPLNSILILSQMLQENNSKTLTHDEQEYARVIHSSGNDLLLLINDILDLSKVEAGKLDIHIGELRADWLPELLLSQFEKVAEQRKLTFRIEMDAQVPKIFYTDEQRLSQIIKNLLSNAFKFTHEGSVHVEFRMCSVEQIVELLPSAMHMQVMAVSVKDTGIGIPTDKQEVIFEAFLQADGTTNRKYGGTGLGLSISRELARLLGGCIQMESVEGQGSTFTLYVPSLPPLLEGMNASHKEVAVATASTLGEYFIRDNGSIPALEDASSNRFKGRKVLVVDDDVRNVFALCNAFEQEGIIVSVAQNGQECLELLAKDPSIELILMDIMMPVMDGYEAMRLIRKNNHYADVPIIALTAKAMKQDREICLQAGASDYISKPLHVNQLLSLMQVWLSK
ncbi:response regulator [Paenibacillus qinlingensis]|nr:response regulator [Paenibacillus qinlingensis]